MTNGADPEHWQQIWAAKLGLFDKVQRHVYDGGILSESHYSECISWCRSAVPHLLRDVGALHEEIRSTTMIYSKKFEAMIALPVFIPDMFPPHSVPETRTMNPWE